MSAMAPRARKGARWVRNAAGRKVPRELDGRTWRPFAGAGRTPGRGMRRAPPIRKGSDGRSKLHPSIREVLEAYKAKSGWTFGFHHHLRNGEGLILPTLGAARELGLRRLRLAQVAMFPVHEPVIGFIEDGTVNRIEGSMNGPVGDLVSHGGLPHPAVLRTHGGRTRAVEAGELHLDMSLIAASEADAQGNANGVNGPHAFGPMAYSRIDWEYADRVAVLTDNLVPYPAVPAPIDESRVDAVVRVDSIGAPEGIKYGTTKLTTDPERLGMAERTVALLDTVGLLREGFSFQAGAGGTSLAVEQYLADHFIDRRIRAGFCMGGTTRFVTRMLEEGCLGAILDAQAFDLEAVESLRRNYPRHMEISPYRFASPHAGSCVVQSVDACFLGGTEVDVDFNVNVNTHSDGRLLHGTGGHSDAAAGAEVAIVLVPVARKDNAIVRDRVTTCTTPGETVDVVVTDRGIAVNPRRKDLLKRLGGTALPIRPIEELRDEAYGTAGGAPEGPEWDTDDVVAVIEYRDGTMIDVVHRMRT